MIIPQVHKVRFVASSLLDAVRKAETAPDSAARAHAYLCKNNPQPLSLILTKYSYTGVSRGFSEHLVWNREELFVRENISSHVFIFANYVMT